MYSDFSIAMPAFKTVLVHIINLLNRNQNALIIVKMTMDIYMYIIINVSKNAQKILKLTKKKRNVWILVQMSNLSIIIYVIMIVPKILIDYSKIEIYVCSKCQKIIILIKKIISIKNVMKDAKLVVKREMKQLIIVMNA